MPRRSSFRHLAAVCCGATLLQGCYAAVPTSLAAVVPNSEVHVTLTSDGAAALVTSVGPRAAALDGRVVARVDSALTLAVTRVARTTRTAEDWPADAITVPWSAVQSVTVHRLSPSRSVVFAGATVVAALLAGRSLRGSGGAGGVRGANGSGAGR
jgi:hypothetical protein